MLESGLDIFWLGVYGWLNWFLVVFKIAESKINKLYSEYNLKIWRNW